MAETDQHVDAILVGQKIPELLAATHHSECSVQDRAALAKALTQPLASDFLEFVEGLGTKEERCAFLDAFQDCIRAWAKCGAVSEQLLVGFADIVSQLCSKPTLGLKKELVTRWLGCLESQDLHLTAFGWKLLGRVPKLINMKTESKQLIQLVERDVCSDCPPVALESTCSLFSILILLHKHSELFESLKQTAPLVVRTIERFLSSEEITLADKEKLLQRLAAMACDELCESFFDDESEKLVEVLLPSALKLTGEEEKQSRILCLKVLPRFKLTETTFSKITETLLSIIQEELQNGAAGSEPVWKSCFHTDLWKAVESSCGKLRLESWMRFDFSGRLLGIFAASTDPDKAKVAAPLLISAIAGDTKLGGDVAVRQLVPMVNSGLKHADPRTRQAYCYISNELMVRGHRGDQVGKVYETVGQVFSEPSSILLEDDLIVRAMIYNRISIYFEKIQPPMAKQINGAMSKWATVLKTETKKYVRTGVGSPLQQALGALSKALVTFKMSCGQQVVCLFPALKMVACLVDLKPQVMCCVAGEGGSKRLVKEDCCRVLSCTAVQCALAAISRHCKAIANEHVPWMTVTLRKLQPTGCFPEGLNKVELLFARHLQDAWKELVGLCRLDLPVLEELLVGAVDFVLWKAAALLSVDECEDLPETKRVARNSGKIYFSGSRRILCVDEEGMKSKIEAIDDLEKFYVREFFDIVYPRLEDVVAVVIDNVTANVGQGLRVCRSSVELDSVSERAARFLPKIVAAAAKKSEADMLKLWDMIQPRLVEFLVDTRWRNCPDHVLSSLSKCLESLPEEQVVSMVPAIASTASKVMDWFSSAGQLSIKNDEDGDADGSTMDESDEFDSIELPTGLAALIETTAKKCGPERAQLLFNTLITHCDKLLALDSRPGNLELGLELLSKWLASVTSTGREQMTWLWERLVALIKRFSAEVKKQDEDPKGLALYDEWDLDVAILLEKATECLLLLVPLYAGDSNATVKALKELVGNLDLCINAQPSESKKKRPKWMPKVEEWMQNIIVWNCLAILNIISKASAIPTKTASEAVKSVLSCSLPSYHEGFDRMVQLLVDLFDAKHPAMMANSVLMVQFARKASDFGGGTLHHIAWECDEADEVPCSEEESFMDDDDFDDYPDSDSSSEKYALGFGQPGTTWNEWLENKYL